MCHTMVYVFIAHILYRNARCTMQGLLLLPAGIVPVSGEPNRVSRRFEQKRDSSIPDGRSLNAQPTSLSDPQPQLRQCGLSDNHIPVVPVTRSIGAYGFISRWMPARPHPTPPRGYKLSWEQRSQLFFIYMCPLQALRVGVKHNKHWRTEWVPPDECRPITRQ